LSRPDLARRYAHWRKKKVGGLTEKLEMELIFEMAGDLSGMRVLDAGMGDGAWSEAALIRGAEVVGLDRDPAMLKAAEKRFKGRASRPEIVPGKLEDLPFPDDSFDVILSIAAICFLSDEQMAQAYREFARVLKPGGRLIIGELGRVSAWNAWRSLKGALGHPTWSKVTFRTAEELTRNLLQAGFEIEERRGAIFSLPLPGLFSLGALVDPTLGRTLTEGGAFLALRAFLPIPGGLPTGASSSIRQMTDG
jgi:ubiquinone/menaquinone biosynthesis C-methylase UbiE